MHANHWSIAGLAMQNRDDIQILAWLLTEEKVRNGAKREIIEGWHGKASSPTNVPSA